MFPGPGVPLQLAVPAMVTVMVGLSHAHLLMVPGYRAARQRWTLWEDPLPGAAGTLPPCVTGLETPCRGTGGSDAPHRSTVCTFCLALRNSLLPRNLFPIHE